VSPPYVKDWLKRKEILSLQQEAVVMLGSGRETPRFEEGLAKGAVTYPGRLRR
jgi:hypothetical protein